MLRKDSDLSRRPIQYSFVNSGQIVLQIVSKSPHHQSVFICSNMPEKLAMFGSFSSFLGLLTPDWDACGRSSMSSKEGWINWTWRLIETWRCFSPLVPSQNWRSPLEGSVLRFQRPCPAALGSGITGFSLSAWWCRTLETATKKTWAFRLKFPGQCAGLGLGIREDILKKYSLGD